MASTVYLVRKVGTEEYHCGGNCFYGRNCYAAHHYSSPNPAKALVNRFNSPTSKWGRQGDKFEVVEMNILLSEPKVVG